MLRAFRHRRQKGMVGFLGLAFLAVFALRGLVVAAPSIALLEAHANGQAAICTGSAIITVDANGQTSQISIDSCDDGLVLADASPPETGAEAPQRFDEALPWRHADAATKKSARWRAHHARAPPLA